MSGRSRRGGVGYKQPPKEHQFKKGASGNPNGRPRKQAAEPKASTTLYTKLDEILLKEAFAPIQVRDNGVAVEMPMIQAVVKGMSVAALKGNQRAGALLLNLFQAAQARRDQEVQEAFGIALRHKEKFLAIFEDCDKRGLPRPDVTPQPEEVVLDYETFEVRFNGPVTSDDKVTWAQGRAEAARLRQIADEFDQEERVEGVNWEVVDGLVARLREEAFMFEVAFPDEETRRTPGFDLQEHKKQWGLEEWIEKNRERFLRDEEELMKLRRERVKSGRLPEKPEF